MVLDSKFTAIRTQFNIQSPSDWCRIAPNQITAIENIGPQTLNHLRLHLAGQGLTLLGDETPAYWQTNLSILRGTSQIADDQNAVVSPFIVLTDKAEQHPFTFAGMRADADENNRPLIVRSKPQHLGPTHGDYTIEGMQGHVHVERKSREDVIGTVLGWGDRREQFQRTLIFLSEIPSSAVIIECTFGQAINAIVSRGKKSASENKKIFHRQVGAWQDDFRVPWVFCDSRRLAEITTYIWLRRYWKHQQKKAKQSAINNDEFEEVGL